MIHDVNFSYVSSSFFQPADSDRQRWRIREGELPLYMTSNLFSTSVTHLSCLSVTSFSLRWSLSLFLLSDKTLSVPTSGNALSKG